MPPGRLPHNATISSAVQCRLKNDGWTAEWLLRGGDRILIYGIGVDCALAERLQKSMTKEGFAKRVFSTAEQQLIAARSGQHAAETAAANFAAKEAFLKAAGTGLGGFALADIEVLRKESGAPYYRLGGSAADFCAAQNLVAHLSVTHENGMAIAFAVLESI